LKLFQEGGTENRVMEGVNSTMLYCKSLGKCHNVMCPIITEIKNHRLEPIKL
jgi:hypothetical protein